MIEVQENRRIIHELNNQGCKCEMCNKINIENNMKIVYSDYVDKQSQEYGSNMKQYLLNTIYKLSQLPHKTRKIQYALPQICVYENCKPSLLIIKKTQKHQIKIIRDHAKMHMFQIIQLFNDGYNYHNPSINNNKNLFIHPPRPPGTQRNKSQCILMAKYTNNFYNMLTMKQIQSLFKSRQKNLRDGLLYLQTIVCSHEYNQIRIKLDLGQQLGSQLLQRAKKQVRILFEEIKSVDIQYISQNQQQLFQKQLKNTNIKQYLKYLTFKIVLTLSKIELSIISKAVFKYVYSDTGKCYLMDIRVSSMDHIQQYWASAVLKAYQFKLSRRISMIDMPNQTTQDRVLSKKAHSISMWLEKSMENQWKQMNIIKIRLERLEKEKKSLIQSQTRSKNSSSVMESNMTKKFKVRSVHRR